MKSIGEFRKEIGIPSPHTEKKNPVRLATQAVVEEKDMKSILLYCEEHHMTMAELIRQAILSYISRKEK